MSHSGPTLKEVLAYDCGDKGGYLKGLNAAIKAIEKVSLDATGTEWVSKSLWERISRDIAARHIAAIEKLKSKKEPK